MRLHTKLLLVFLFVTIVPLGVLSFFELRSVREGMIQNIGSNLQAIANIQEQRVGEVISRYLEWARLVTSRTQLRASFKAYNDSGDPAHVLRMETILADAIASLPDIRALTLLDTKGAVVASTLANPSQRTHRTTPLGTDTFSIDEVFKDVDGIFSVRVIGPVVLDDARLGTLELVAHADRLITITQDYTGLGETGEVLLGKKNSAGDALFLTPLRFDADAALQRAVSRTQTDVPIVHSFTEERAIFTDPKTVDYRGDPVFAATGFVRATGWGVVAKISRAEALSTFHAVRQTTLVTFSIIVLVLLLVSYGMSRVITEPLRTLIRSIETMKKGNFTHRVSTHRRDELGELARAFNGMASQLETMYTDLQNVLVQQKSKLNETQQSFEGAFTSSPIGMALVSPEGKWLQVNDALCRMVGYSKEELLQSTFQDITHPDDLNTDLEHVQEMLRKERTTYQMKKRYIRKDKTVVWVLLSVSLVWADDGTPQYFVSQIQDITAEEKSQKKLEEKIQELERMNKVMVDRELRMVELKDQVKNITR